MAFKFNANAPQIGEERNLYTGKKSYNVGDTEQAYIPDGRGGLLFGLLNVVGLCRDDERYQASYHLNGEQVPSNRGEGYTRFRREE